MALKVTMPQMGESVMEGTIERWSVSPGDAVEKDQVLCEITTDKVDAEIPAPESGVLTEILVQAGQTVEVGAEICVIEVGAVQTKPAAAPAADAAPASTDTAERASAPPPAEDASAGRISPLARRMAEDQGIEWRDLQGSGPAGRVTRADLESSPSAPTTQAPAPASAPATEIERAAPAAPGSLGEWLSHMRIPTYTPREGDKLVPFSAVRRRVAEHMVVSKIVSPHVGTVAELDLNKLVQLREGVKSQFKKQHGFSLTYLPFIVQATMRALKEFPRMNATVVGENIVERPGIHIGVAVETERGLLVPVIRDADRLSLTGLAQAMEDLSGRARSKAITADELQGGTFTVTNPGRQGNLYGFAVINQPQVGILRMGEVKKKPVVVERDGDEAIVVHPVMHLALSYDHRIIDGVTGNGFLFRVGELLEAGEFEL